MTAPGVAADYAYLCCNCGAINRYADWTFMRRDHDDDDGKLVPLKPGEADPVCVCPKCGFEHEDNDSSPGIYDGTLAELAAERARLQECNPEWEDPPVKCLTTIGYDVLLIDKLAERIHRLIEHGLAHTDLRRTLRGRYFEVLLADHRIARVTVELDRVDPDVDVET